MPKYEYKCSKCEKRYEVIASIHESPEAPKCCEKIERIFSSIISGGQVQVIVGAIWLSAKADSNAL